MITEVSGVVPTPSAAERELERVCLNALLEAQSDLEFAAPIGL
jgi:hypothetical protein